MSQKKKRGVLKKSIILSHSKKRKKRERSKALSSDPMTRSKKHTFSEFAGQLVPEGSAWGVGRGDPREPTYLHCCLGPSIGRAGCPHQPRCSPRWHLSGEGAVSQDPTPEPSASLGHQPPAAQPRRALPPESPSGLGDQAAPATTRPLRHSPVTFPHFLPP